MKKWKRWKKIQAVRPLQSAPLRHRQPACPFSPQTPASAETRRRSRSGSAWQRAGVEWVETMSFVAQAAKGGGVGDGGEKVLDRVKTKQNKKRLRNARKCSPGNTRAPLKTRIEDCASEVSTERNERGPFRMDGACPSSALSLGGNGSGTTEVSPGPVAHSLGGPSAPLGLR